MSELFKDIPEFVEVGLLAIRELMTGRNWRVACCEDGNLGYVVQTTRLTLAATFRELGPPDLCHVIKSSGSKAAQKDIAQQAVNSAPSEFVTWAKLTETFIELGQYDSALLTLNSCPMFTFNERDLHRMPTPAKTHLPVKKFIAESNILDEESARDNEIGWDELLRTRSTVFVMEEEYRLHKTSGSVDDISSVAGTKSPPRTPATPSDIPTIRISSESDRSKPNGKVPVLEKPEMAQAMAEPGSPLAMKTDDDEEFEASTFSNKRLCERWLEVGFALQSAEIELKWRQWEILGELAQRLHHKEEAKDAFQRCLDAKFSAKALLKLLEAYANEGDLQRTLNAAIRLTTYHHR
ncbi:hypothetical protein P7C73_g263, partial [Tremellales sp. Uapishka_1]